MDLSKAGWGTVSVCGLVGFDLERFVGAGLGLACESERNAVGILRELFRDHVVDLLGKPCEPIGLVANRSSRVDLGTLVNVF